MKIAVIGAGAIGNLVAGYLKRAEEDVLLIARPDSVGAIQASGLHLSGARGAFQVEVAISGHLDEAPDLAILAVKTQDIPEALDKSKELLKKSILVTTQNGIQADVIASRHHPRECIVPSIVMFGATCLEPGQVVHNFEGSWIIGRLFATDEEILQKVQFVLNKAFPTVISDNIKGMKYLKVFVNANNCIPAILGMSMQEAFSDVATSRICLAVWKEGLDIVTRSAIALASLPNFSKEWLSEFDTNVILSNCDNLQFIKGSEDKPVSQILTYGVNSSKQSSIVSNPDIEPNKENQGVQICAGIKIDCLSTSKLNSKRSLASIPIIGLPSAFRLPRKDNLLLNSFTLCKFGIKITL